MELNRSRTAPAAVVLLLAAAACARPGFPPGGPTDRIAPRVVGVSPDSLGTLVDREAPLTITFSETVDGKTLERALWITPSGVEKPRIDVDGEVVTIHPGRAYPESSTVGILLTTVIEDRTREGPRNPLGEPYRWVFSTGSSIAPGVVSGTVEVEGTNTQRGQILVGLYPAVADTVPDPNEVDPVAITQARSDGTFRIEGAPADSVSRWLLAMMDRDGNRRIEGAGEFVTAKPDSVILTAGVSQTRRTLSLVDPEAPGTIEGTLLAATVPDTSAADSSAADTVEVRIVVYEVGPDADLAPIRTVKAGRDGSFEIDRLAPGEYRLLAFCDIDHSGRRETGETAVEYVVIRLLPAQTRRIEDWVAPDCSP